MAINYEDERLAEVEQERQDALDKAEATYGGMIDKSQQLYQEQIDATKAWEEEQKQLQQQQTDFAIQETARQKEQAEKDYKKEQSAAYADWQKEKNAYGVQAEQMADAGLAGSGYSESSMVSMYNAYQARVTAARESVTQAVADFDAAMQAAVLQNDVAMAEIAFQALQQRMTLSLEGFQYENQLIFALEEEKKAIDSQYDSKWQDVLSQLLAEEAAAIKAAQGNGSSESVGDQLFLENPAAVEENAGKENNQVSANDLYAPVKEEKLTDDGSGGWEFTAAPQQAKKPGPDQIKAMQAALGIPQTGRWDAASRKATGKQSLVEAYALWQKGEFGGSWRRKERRGTLLVADSLKGYTEEELEKLVENDSVKMTQVGGNILLEPSW